MKMRTIQKPYFKPLRVSGGFWLHLKCKILFILCISGTGKARPSVKSDLRIASYIEYVSQKVDCLPTKLQWVKGIFLLIVAAKSFSIPGIIVENY